MQFLNVSGGKRIVAFLLIITLFVPFITTAAERTERTERQPRAERTVVAPRVIDSFTAAEVSVTSALSPRAPREVRRIRAQHVENEVIVKFDNERRERRMSTRGQDVAEMIAELEADPNVLYVEPNYLVQAFAVPNDPHYDPFQWNFDNDTHGGVNAEAAWDITDGSGVIVAVLDTGVAYENYDPAGSEQYTQAPDLAGTTFVQGYDFVNNDTHANDDNGHGTHVAGTLAGSTNDNTGAAGLAYGASIMPIKVLDRNGGGTYADVAEGIRFAADNGAQVINLSLGGPVTASYLEEALAYAHGKGVTIVAASGNDGSNSVSYPAAYNDYVIAVGATRYDETIAPYSNQGSALDLVAPGGDTAVDQNGDGYGDGILQQTLGSNNNTFGYFFYNGTSMAAPHVAAAAAMVIASGKASTPAAVQSLLESTADDLGSSGRDNTYGHGIINVAAAVSGATPTTPPATGPEPNPEPVVDPEPEPEPTGTLFEDSFENGLSNWTQDRQNDWRFSGRKHFAGRGAAEVDGRANNSQLISPLIVTGGADVRVSFAWFIERSFDSNEYIAVDISTDGGITWTEHDRLRGNADEEDVWHNATITLNSVSSVQVRFRSSVSSPVEDGYVDAVLIESL